MYHGCKSFLSYKHSNTRDTLARKPSEVCSENIYISLLMAKTNDTYTKKQLKSCDVVGTVFDN